MGRRVLIFDFDGTLADTFDLFLDVFDEAAALYRFEPFDRNNLDYLRTLDARSILQYHRVPAWKLPVIAQTTRKLMERHVEAIRLFAGIESTIANLHDRGATLALLSSNSRSNAIRVLGQEMASHFDYLECGVSIFGKRAKLRNLLARSGFAAANTILIGDEIRDAPGRQSCRSFLWSSELGLYRNRDYVDDGCPGIFLFARGIDPQTNAIVV
jgi:phosphoglycolate phosphatase